MKVQLALVAASVLALTAACTNSKSSDSSTNGKAKSESSAPKCLDGLRVCVGDSLTIIPYTTPLAIQGQEVVTEVVKRGDLSTSEQQELATLTGFVHDTAEKMMRDSSQDNGPRILTARATYNRDDQNTLFATKGCVQGNVGCVGDKVSTFTTEVVIEEVIGLALDINSAEPFLVRGTSLKNVSFLAQLAALGKPLADKGCATLQPWNRPFCVGEKYQAATMMGDSFTSTEVTVIDISAQSAVLRRSDGTQVLYPDQGSISGFYNEAGCVAGTTDMCLPQVAGETLIAAKVSDQGVGSQSKMQIEGQLLGILIPRADVTTAQAAVLFSRTDGFNENLNIGDKDSLLFHKKGCTTDGSICVGQSFTYVDKSSRQPSPQTFRVLGVNAGLNKVFGSVPGPWNVTYILSPTDLTK